jgi:AraC family transcriptional regulator, regulatory protein of adaptative response / DNA-3-methyladenine glycosylase II
VVVVTALLDDEQRYAALLARERRFDGEFFVAVKTTGIYCRPSCPTPVHPKRSNVTFHRSAASAQQAGYRACKRCRPDESVAAPGRLRTDDLAGRALRLIEDGAVDRLGVTGLAAQLHVSTRQLTRVLTLELGAGPLALARARRAQTARVLIETTAIPFGDVAFASGFTSIRQFNDTIQEIFAAQPTELRSTKSDRRRETGAITVRLPHRKPIDIEGLLSFFAARAVSEVEQADATSYTRTIALPGGPGVARISTTGDELFGSFWLTSLGDLGSALSRVRRLFDLDADPLGIHSVFAADELLGPVSDRHPGRRAPGAVDGHELAVKAVLGQQVSVQAARTLARRLVAARGRDFTIPGAPLSRLFPSSADIASASPDEFAIPRSRGMALIGMCTALADGEVDLSIGVPRAEASEALLALKGIGPWTASYIAMRALSDPDVLLDDDLGVIHGARSLGLPVGKRALQDRGRAWAPWRSYATQLLWCAAQEAAS